MSVSISDSGIVFNDGSLQPTALTTGTQTIAGAKTFSTAPTFANVPTVSTPQSMVRVNTANGYGSTNTRIRRFTNGTNGVNGAVIQGTDITYADSATLGASFTINTSGIYAISYNDNFSAPEYFGVSLNTSQPTTNIVSINQSDRLSHSWTGTDQQTVVPWCGYLAAGSVIRPHSQAAASGTQAAAVQFTITRVS